MMRILPYFQDVTARILYMTVVATLVRQEVYVYQQDGQLTGANVNRITLANSVKYI